MSATDAGCDLCQAARLTTWHHEDDICWVADCEVCDVPMVVWKHHGTDPPPAELAHMKTMLERAARARFDDWAMDAVRRQIPDHWHAHGRPAGKSALKWWTHRFLGR